MCLFVGPSFFLIMKNVCDGCPLRDRYGKCHWRKGDYCKVTDKEYYGN